MFFEYDEMLYDVEDIIDLIGYDIFYGIEDDIIKFENCKKEDLEKEEIEKDLYHKE
jgi:hypothetical protein